MSRTRISWIDNARAIGILLVVIGHLDGLPFIIRKLIYSFHIPLFFLISGYLFKEKYVHFSFLNFFYKRFKSLLVPYLFFGILSLPHFLLCKIMSATSIPPNFGIFDAIIGFVLGIRSMLWLNTALWFFLALFVCNMLFWLLYRSFGLFTLFISLVYFILFSKTLHIHFPLFCIDVSLYLLPFLCIGFFLKKYSLLDFFFKLKVSHKIFLTFCFFVIFYFAFTYNSYVDFFQLMLGKHILTILVAIFASFFVFYISESLPDTRILNLISKDSIVIFPLHLKIFGILTFLFVNFLGVSRSTLSTFPFMFIYFFIGVAFPIIFASFLRSKIPWAIGGR